MPENKDIMAAPPRAVLETNLAEHGHTRFFSYPFRGCQRKAIVAEPGIIPVGKTAVAVLTDHLRKMLRDATEVGEDFDCLVSMRGQDNDAVRGQMAAEETKQVLNSLAIEMRDERAAPDQIKLLTEIKRTEVLCGVSGTHLKCAYAEVYRMAVEVAGREARIREPLDQETQHTPIAARQIEHILDLESRNLLKNSLHATHAGQADVPVTRRVAGIHIVAWRNPRIDVLQKLAA